jgi:hypothetical protein
MTYIDSEVGWAQMKLELAALLDSLVPGRSITLHVRRRRHFVRATTMAWGRLRLEAVSNGHLSSADRIDLEALDLLEDLGWHAPTHFVEQGEPAGQGSSHHFIDRPPGWTGAEVASMLVRTLRGVYEVVEPDDLALRTDVRPQQIEPAARPADARWTADDIVAEVVEAIEAIAPVLEITHVADTDRVVRIVADDGALTVFLDQAHRLLRATVPILTGFVPTTASLLALNDCMRPMRCGRLELRDTTVCALIDLPADPGAGLLLAGYLASVDAALEGIRHALSPFAQPVDEAPIEPVQ